MKNPIPQQIFPVTILDSQIVLFCGNPKCKTRLWRLDGLLLSFDHIVLLIPAMACCGCDNSSMVKKYCEWILVTISNMNARYTRPPLEDCPAGMPAGFQPKRKSSWYMLVHNHSQHILNIRLKLQYACSCMLRHARCAACL